MKKKIDSRIQTLIENIIKLNQRGFFIIIGDRGRDQVVNLHYFIAKHSFGTHQGNKPKVLWCYKKDLGFSTHRQKRAKEIKRLQKRGLFNANMDDPFELFVSSQEIRYCYYKESHKVLGQTYTMLVLQDFASLTPNVLCRTIETVAGGGVVIMLLDNIKALRQIYSLTMDVHSRYRTDQFQNVQPRFNERFILSLSKCSNCLVLDDELNVLPINAKSVSEIQPILDNNNNDNIISGSSFAKELDSLKKDMQLNKTIGPVVQLCVTLDQAKAIMLFAEALMEKGFYSTVSLTAARGRGKSAAIGLAVGVALSTNQFNNIFVTAPSPENVQTLFEFICKGLDALNYKENQHYEVIQSTNPEYQACPIRINIFKSHKQLVQFIFPQHDFSLSACDLLVIDEAAAIPLHYVKRLLGPYTVFLSSTVNGYEGTGRSLSLKLIQQLKAQQLSQQSNSSQQINYQNQQNIGVQSIITRTVKEITMKDPIRYSINDPIEAWLNMLLCLEATSAPALRFGLPPPSKCDLLLVNRDTLFSFHRASEAFLFNLMSLFISSHYKNSPNDLQLLSDAPGHCVFVLLSQNSVAQMPASKLNKQESKNNIPDILCAVQVSLEGHISKQLYTSKFERGNRPSGDLIPWTIAEQFQDADFASLSGARVVRIAVHPQAQKMGYGTQCIQQLQRFFNGECINLIDMTDDLSNQNDLVVDFFAIQTGQYQNQNQSNQNNQNQNTNTESQQAQQTTQPSQQALVPRSKLKPLLKKLSEVRPPHLHYLGVAFGLTPELFRFWQKSCFQPLYLRHSQNDITAEHSCIMLHPLKVAYHLAEQTQAVRVELGDVGWVNSFFLDFKKRFISLLGFEFRGLQVGLCLAILDPMLTTKVQNDNDKEQEEDKYEESQKQTIQQNELKYQINLYDLKRLDAYSKNLIDYHLILDLLPILAKLFFTQRFPAGTRLSYAQAAILLGMGLQFKSVDTISSELNLPVSQLLALFNKSIKKLTTKIRNIYEGEVKREMECSINKNQQMLLHKKIEQLNPLKNQEDEIAKEGAVIVKQLQMLNQGKSIQQSQNQNQKLEKCSKGGNPAHIGYSLEKVNDMEIENVVQNKQLSSEQSVIIPRSVQQQDNRENQQYQKKKKKKTLFQPKNLKKVKKA